MVGAIGRFGAAVQFKRSNRTRPPRRVFISYSHADFQHCDRLAQVLRPLCEEPGDEVWLDSSRLKAGDHWREEIAIALAESQYFVLLLSQDYRASDVCMNFELARILARERSQSGVRVIGVPVHQVALDLFSCPLDDGSVQDLGELQCVPQSDHDIGVGRRKGLVPSPIGAGPTPGMPGRGCRTTCGRPSRRQRRKIRRRRQPIAGGVRHRLCPPSTPTFRPWHLPTSATGKTPPTNSP